MKDNPKREVPLSYLTDVYAHFLLVKHRYEDATAEFELEIRSMESAVGYLYPELSDLLKLQADALHHLNRDEDARKAEAHIHEIEASQAKMRKQIDADPECKFPWEVK